MTTMIRNVTPHDLTQLTELMYEYIVDFYKNPAPSEEKLHSMVHLLMDQQEGIQFIAEDQGKCVGFATLFFTLSTMKADRIAVMNDLYVQEAYRNSELEEKLYHSCVTYAREHGFANMTWITASDNTRAQSFFHAMNARQGREWVHFSMN
ncbi:MULTISPECIES: GNAT family N-acetyltransferase [Paenibacillus]|uniref:GNAT family N-acetyltransferase n=1 Tax=Paenibacillus TaxID=44249 RepID=UPI0003F7A378|nr:GNAT family N-acetyltransferase [Paenibacillus massiliensis]